MSARPTIVIVVLAAGAVLVWALLARGGAGPPPGAVAALAATARLPVDAVDRITLARAGEPALVFERGELGWTQTQPFPYPMQFYELRQLITAVTQLQVVRRMADDEAGEDLGLDPPRAVLGLVWPQGSVTLQLGRRGVAGRSYLRVAGDPSVYVVTGDAYEKAVEVDPREWRERTLFAGMGEPQRVEIVDGDRRTVLERSGRRWTMLEPVRTRADELAVNDLLSALARAQSAGFILDRPQDPGTFGLGDPAARVTARSGGEDNPSEQTLFVGARMGVGSEDRFGLVEGRPVVLRLPEAVLRALFPQPATLIDPTGTGVNPADVKAIVIRGPGGELRLERDLERWIAPDLGAAASAETVESLLDLLARRRAQEVQIVESFPMDAPSITLHGFNGRPMDTVRLAAPPGGGVSLENGDNVLRVFGPDTTVPLTAADFGIN